MKANSDYTTGNLKMDEKIAKALAKEQKGFASLQAVEALINPIIPKQNKYSNTKTVVDGITFDSKKEAKRYSELKLLEQGKYITNLVLQPKYVLLEKGENYFGVKWRSITYIADFAYNGLDMTNKILDYIVEDVKGVRTPSYQLKKHLFLSKFPHYRFIEI